jgi:hypothetical protein
MGRGDVRLVSTGLEDVTAGIREGTPVVKRADRGKSNPGVVIDR